MKDVVWFFYKKCIMLSGLISVIFGLVILGGGKFDNSPLWLAPVVIVCGVVVLIGETLSHIRLLFKGVRGIGEKGLAERIKDIEKGMR